MSLPEFIYFFKAAGLLFAVGFHMLLLGLAFWFYLLSKKRGTNAKCLLSLCMLLSSWGITGLGTMVGSKFEVFRTVSAILVTVMLAATIVAATLAVIGLTECAKQKKVKGKTSAIVTLSVASLVFSFLAIGMLSGLRGARRPEMLTFDTYNFRFRSPDRPWTQINSQPFGPKSRVAFAYPRYKISFAIIADRLHPPITSRQAMVENTKFGLRATSVSYHFLQEGKASYNGITGWQTETEASIQGHPLYHVHWFVTSGDYCYDLGGVGPADERERIKNLVQDLYSKFELTSPQEPERQIPDPRRNTIL